MKVLSAPGSDTSYAQLLLDVGNGGAQISFAEDDYAWITFNDRLHDPIEISPLMNGQARLDIPTLLETSELITLVGQIRRNNARDYRGVAEVSDAESEENPWGAFEQVPHYFFEKLRGSQDVAIQTAPNALPIFSDFYAQLYSLLENVQNNVSIHNQQVANEEDAIPADITDLLCYLKGALKDPLDLTELGIGEAIAVQQSNVAEHLIITTFPATDQECAYIQCTVRLL